MTYLAPKMHIKYSKCCPILKFEPELETYGRALKTLIIIFLQIVTRRVVTLTKYCVLVPCRKHILEYSGLGIWKI